MGGSSGIGIKDQGITKLPNGSTVVNVGSLTRGSLHLDDLDRKPCVVEVKMTKEDIEFVRHNVPVRPAVECFKVEEAVREKDDSQRMTDIVDRMKKIATDGWTELTLKSESCPYAPPLTGRRNSLTLI